MTGSDQKIPIRFDCDPPRGTHDAGPGVDNPLPRASPVRVGSRIEVDVALSDRWIVGCRYLADDNFILRDLIFYPGVS